MAASALLLALVAAATVLFPGSSADPKPLTPRLEPLTDRRGPERHPAISPDGKRVAFVWNGGQGAGFGVYVRPIDGATVRRLTTSRDRACCLAWSPDQRSLAFVRTEGSQSALWTVSVEGGGERRLGAISSWFGTSLSWSPEGGEIAFSDRAADDEPFAIFLLETGSLERRRLTRPSRRFLGDALPRFSPDGRSIAFSRIAGSGDALTVSDLYVAPASGSGQPRALTAEGRFIADLGWSPDGRSLLVASGRDGATRLWRVATGGGRPPTRVFTDPDPSLTDTLGEVASEAGLACRFSVSPQGGAIALTQLRYDTNIWQIAGPASGSEPAFPLFASDRPDESPQFSPDGRHVALSSSRSGPPEIWICGRDGRDCGPLSRLHLHSGTPRWSPDGKRIAFDSRPDGQADIMVKDVATRVTLRITADRAEDVVPSFSRDGRFIYFASNRTGRFEVWKAPAEGGSAVRVTSAGGFAAFESRDGTAVYFTKQATPGLWTVPSGGGPERQVLDQPSCWGYWALTRSGILFLDSRQAPPILAHQSLATGSLTRSWALEMPPACGESGLAVSPDERTVLYVGARRETRIQVVTY